MPKMPLGPSSKLKNCSLHSNNNSHEIDYEPFKVNSFVNIEKSVLNHACAASLWNVPNPSLSAKTNWNNTTEKISMNNPLSGDDSGRIRGADKRRLTNSELDLYRSSDFKKVSLDDKKDEDEILEAVHKIYGKSLDEFLKSCFNKSYSFKFIKDYNLRKRKREAAGKRFLYTTEKWKPDDLEKFQAVKGELNSVKEKLNNFNLNEWHRHTSSTNPADIVTRRLRIDMKVEFSTQAWCKFYELMSELHLIPKEAVKSKMFYTVHLCEAPGAFVASLNHYIKLNHPDMEWKWTANSLNPFYEGNNLSHMINDDRFMLQTIDKWDFGPDMTGDITHPGYPDYLFKKHKDHLPHLVTADGSFDCQDKPEEQESSVSWLHLKETLTALNILRKGGYFVIKMFTFFECDTICLLYLLAIVFESVDVKKPATSKEGNSEVYVVCREFKGEHEVRPYLSELLKITQEEHRKCAMFPYEHISRIVSIKILECAKYFAEIQKKVIERNIALFFCNDYEETVKRPCQFVQEKLWDKYVENFKLSSISHRDNIVPLPKFEIRKNSSVNVFEKRERPQGSHADRIKRRTLDEKDIIDKMFEELNSLMGIPKWMKNPEMPDLYINIEDFKVNVGKQITTIVSSQFCHGSFIRMRNELMNAVSITQFNIFAIDPKTSREFDCGAHAVYDFGEIFMRETDYSEAQLMSFRKIHEKVLELKENDDLILISYPLLTQFNVNVVCCLKQMFEKIEFRAPNILYLHSMSTDERNKWFFKVDEILRNYTKSSAVISFLPLKYVTGFQNPIYSWIVDVNNIRVYNELELVIKFKKQ